MTTQNYGNYNNRNRYDNDRRDSFRPQRPKVINLTKTYKSFEDGYAELIKLIPEIKTYGGEDVIYEAVIGNIINTIHDNIPSHSSSSYPNTFSFSIDSHEVGIRTDAGMAFGWRTFFNKDSGEVVYKFRVSFITIPTHRKAIINNMKDNGWEVFETGRQSRFWDKVDNRRGTTNRREFPPKEVNAVAEVKEEPKEHTQQPVPLLVNTQEEQQVSSKESIDVSDPPEITAFGSSKVTTTNEEPPQEEAKQEELGEINEDIASQLQGYKFD